MAGRANQMKLSPIPKGVRIYCCKCKKGQCDQCEGVAKPDIYHAYPCNCKHLKTARVEYVANEVAAVARLNSLFQFVLLIAFTVLVAGCNDPKLVEIRDVRVIACRSNATYPAIDTMSETEYLQSFDFEGSAPDCTSWKGKDQYWNIWVMKLPLDGNSQKYIFVKAATE